MSDYPSQFNLKAIQEWDCTTNKGLMSLAEFVVGEWHFGEPWGRLSRRIKDNSWKEPRYYRKLTLSTGGWSGNESLISALTQNWLWWSMCFHSHHTGGHFIFRIYENRIKEDNKK